MYCAIRREIFYLLLLGFDNLLLDGTDDTDGDGLLHVTDGETTKSGVLGEGLDDEWLGWDDKDDGTIIPLEELWLLGDLLTVTAVDLLDELLELAGDVSGVAVENWLVTGVDLAWVVGDDHLSGEVTALDWWVAGGVTDDVTPLDVRDWDVLDVETDVVTWKSLWELGVVHFNGLDISSDGGWGEDDVHAWLEDTGLDTADWDGTDTGDLVDILDWETEWLVEWPLWWGKAIENLKKAATSVPWHVGGAVDHVVTSEAGDWDELVHLWLVTDVGEDAGHFALDFVETSLVVVDGAVIHLVASNDELLDTEGEGEESVLTGLALLGDTTFETTAGGVDDEDSSIGLGGTGDHVLDEVSMSWGIDDGEEVLWRLELPEGDIDGDTTFTLGLEVIHNEGVLERALAELLGFLLDLSELPLVDTAALVDQVTGGGGLTSIDVTDNDKIDMILLLTHEKSK